MTVQCRPSAIMPNISGNHVTKYFAKATTQFHNTLRLMNNTGNPILASYLLFVKKILTIGTNHFSFNLQADSPFFDQYSCLLDYFADLRPVLDLQADASKEGDTPEHELLPFFLSLSKFCCLI